MDYHDKQLKLLYAVTIGGLVAAFFAPLGAVGLYLGIAGLVVSAVCGLCFLINKSIHEEMR